MTVFNEKGEATSNAVPGIIVKPVIRGGERITMQIVIDIPEDVYTRLFDNGIQDNEIAVDDVCEMARAIRIGTPLPKGHGRIKDIDKIEWYGCTTEFDCPHKDRECKNCDRAECSKTQVDAIPTIIEADKEIENTDGISD